MTIVGQIDSLWRYPVKSMRGEEVDEAFAGFSGVYGDRLLSALLGRARADGYSQISLSVEPDSPAKRLYERHGFERVGEDEDTLTMRASLQ